MSKGVNKIKDYVKTAIQGLCDDPSTVAIRTMDGKSMVVVEVTVGSLDFPKVIGKKGRNINAVKQLATAVGAKFGQKVVIELVENIPGRK